MSDSNKKSISRTHKFSQLSALLISMSLLGTVACAERAGTKKNAKVTKKSSADAKVKTSEVTKSTKKKTK